MWFSFERWLQVWRLKKIEGCNFQREKIIGVKCNSRGWVIFSYPQFCVICSFTFFYFSSFWVLLQAFICYAIVLFSCFLATLTIVYASYALSFIVTILLFSLDVSLSPSLSIERFLAVYFMRNVTFKKMSCDNLITESLFCRVDHNGLFWLVLNAYSFWSLVLQEASFFGTTLELSHSPCTSLWQHQPIYL